MSKAWTDPRLDSCNGHHMEVFIFKKSKIHSFNSVINNTWELTLIFIEISKERNDLKMKLHHYMFMEI